MKATNHDLKTLHPYALRDACKELMETDPDLCAIVCDLKARKPEPFASRNRRRRLHEPERN